MYALHSNYSPLHLNTQLVRVELYHLSLVIARWSLYNKPTMRTLYQCLLDTDLARLRVIARFWDVELISSRQRDVAAQLAEAIAVPEAITSAWDALPDDQRRALESLLAAEGRMPLRVFTREWGEIRTVGPGRMEREQLWREPISPAEGLWYHGFIARAFEQGDEGTYEVAFVPSELRAHLPAPSNPLLAITLEPAPEPADVRSAGDALLDDACTLLAYLQNERLRPRPGGEWPVHHEARLARRLRDLDPARLTFLRHLVQHLGWLRVTDSGRLRPGPGPVAAWLQSPVSQQQNVLVEAWRDDPTWNDLFHVPTLHPEDTGAWHNDPLLPRRAIMRHLEVCTPDAWYRLDDFVAAVKQADPDFQRPDGDYTTWYIRDAATGAYLSGFERWNAIEGALIRYFITGPLAWFGLTNLGIDQYPMSSSLRPLPLASPPAPCFLLPSSFRLTPAGATFLGLAKPPPEPEPAPLALRSDFSVLTPPARRYERFQLARVADWVTSPLAGGTKGGVSPLVRGTEGSASPLVRRTNGTSPLAGGIEGGHFVYRLTPASLERARRQGIPVARVLEFLGRVTGTPVPRFVETALTRWEARGAEARLEQVVLLRLSNEGLMAQVTASPRTRHLIREQVGPAAALVRGRDWPRLVAALGEMGLLADVIGLEEGNAD